MLGVPVGAAVTGSETELRPVPPVWPRNTQVTGHRGRQRAESRERSRDLPRRVREGGGGSSPSSCPLTTRARYARQPASRKHLHALHVGHVHEITRRETEHAVPRQGVR